SEHLHPTSPLTIYSPSLHDALPISTAALEGGALDGADEAAGDAAAAVAGMHDEVRDVRGGAAVGKLAVLGDPLDGNSADEVAVRSEEHTSELQSHLNLVCRLLLEPT